MMTRLNMLKTSAILILALGLAGCASSGPRQQVGGVLGAIGGGLLGAQVGSGSGRLIATGAGAVLGGLLGAEVGDGLDKAQGDTARRPALVQHPQQAPIRQSSAGYTQHAPNYGTTPAYASNTAPSRGTSNCNQLSGGLKPAFACQDNFGRWFVVQ